MSINEIKLLYAAAATAIILFAATTATRPHCQAATYVKLWNSQAALSIQNQKIKKVCNLIHIFVFPVYLSLKN